MKAREDGTTDLYYSGMTEARIAMLEEVGFVWSVKRGKGRGKKEVPPPVTWDDRMEELKLFKQHYGHADVPQDSPLGKWIETQKTIYATGALTLERVSLLESEGVFLSFGSHNIMSKKPSTSAVREYDDPQDEWNQRLDELKEYREEHGNCLVPTKYIKNPKLGRFVSTQRTQYHSYMQAKEEGNTDITTRNMNEDRIMQLEAIGFVWTVKGRGVEDKNATIRWNTRYEELKAYKEEHGDVLVPFKYPQNPQLVRWISNQRQMYSRYQTAKAAGTTDKMAGAMNEDRIAKLEDLGFGKQTL